MKVKWYGHSAFLITTAAGVRIITDPYQSGAFGGALSYGRITEEADIVLSSHDHDDHNYTKDIRGEFIFINKEGVYHEKGVTIRAVATFHDTSRGSERGRNLIFVIEADDMTLAHAGDLGHTLDAAALKELGRIDILLVPVGGFYTIDAQEAASVVEDIKPLVTIPMHFKTDKCDFPITPVEDFTKGKTGVRYTGETEVEYSRATLPSQREIVVLGHTL
ncbi:MAG TPA: MBL fold metallo-hydrolase [Deltaproteobacteria bacterium]|nr:MBL fold metallo-hydrolase [Deltaproteobacteria bacterium]